MQPISPLPNIAKSPTQHYTIPSPYSIRETTHRPATSTCSTPLSPTFKPINSPRTLSSTQTTFINVDHTSLPKAGLPSDYRPPLYSAADLSYNSSVASNASTSSNTSTSSYSVSYFSDFSPTGPNFPVSRNSQQRSFASYSREDSIDPQQFYKKTSLRNKPSPLTLDSKTDRISRQQPIAPYSSIGSCLAPAGFGSQAKDINTISPDKTSTSHLVMAIFPVEDYDTKDTMKILFDSNIGSMQGDKAIERTSYWEVDGISDLVTLVQFPDPNIVIDNQTADYMDNLLGYCLGLTSIIIMVSTYIAVFEIETLYELTDHLVTTMETIDPSSSWWSRVLIVFDDKETQTTEVSNHRATVLNISLPCIRERHALEKTPSCLFINSRVSDFLDAADYDKYQQEAQRVLRHLVQVHHQNGWWRGSLYSGNVEQEEFSSSEEDIAFATVIEPKKREPLPRNKVSSVQRKFTKKNGYRSQNEILEFRYSLPGS
ncbi:hypothetical protein F4703DRAFT_1147191 [Phycomyces blakesleeanus]